MKLRTKITLASAGLLLLLSQAFSIWNLSRTQEQIIENIRSYEYDRLSSDVWRFNKTFVATKYHDIRGAKYAARETFCHGYSENAVLYYDNEELYNLSPYLFDMAGLSAHSEDPAQDIPLSGSAEPDITDPQQNIFLEEVGGRKLLILFQDLSVDGDHSPNSLGTLRILHYRDITPVYQSGRQLLFQGLAVALLISVLLALLLICILRKILAPFYLLRDAANVIADGDYKKRIEHPGTDEVGEVSRSFNQMAERIEEHIRTLAEMNETQRQLIGSLAHELKTPMTGIQGYAELLQRVQLPPSKQADALHYIEEECIRLSRLSAKMLLLTDLSREDTVEKKPCLVSALFSQAGEVTHYRLKEKSIRLQTDLEQDFYIEGDADLLLSFLTNLIDNACKACPPGSCIRLTGTASGIFVEDEGIGIPPEELSRITEPFYMVNKSRSRRQGGAGLGLSLCFQIARLHGGHLEIRSTPGKGTCIGMRYGKLQDTANSTGAACKP